MSRRLMMRPEGPAIVPAATLIRWSGALLVAAGVVRVLYPWLHPAEDGAGYQSAAWVPVHLVAYLSLVAVLLGLVAAFVRHLAGLRRLEVVGFATAFVGTALMIMEGHGHIYFLPRLAAEQPGIAGAPPGVGLLIAGSLVFAVGFVLLGVALARGDVVPRAAGVLLALGAPIVAFSPPIGIRVVAIVGECLFGLGLAWLGHGMWSAVEPSAARPAA